MNCRRIALVLVSALALSCTKKADPTATGAGSVITGDGGSMSGPLGLALGKPVEGVLRCPLPMWFVVLPPTDAQAKFELEIPKGADQLCTHLNAHDASGRLLDSTVSLCSDNPAVFAVGQAPFAKEVTFFSIVLSDPAAKCVPARFRVSVLGNK